MIDTVHNHKIYEGRIKVSDSEYERIREKIRNLGYPPTIGEVPVKATIPKRDGFYWIKEASTDTFHCQKGDDFRSSFTCARYFVVGDWQLIRVLGGDVDFFGSDEGYFPSEIRFITQIKKADVKKP